MHANILMGGAAGSETLMGGRYICTMGGAASHKNSLQRTLYILRYVVGGGSHLLSITVMQVGHSNVMATMVQAVVIISTGLHKTTPGLSL